MSLLEIMMLKIQVVWDVVEQAVSDFSKGGSAFSFRLNLSKCLTLIFKALRSFETSGTARPTVQRHVSGNF